MQDFNKRINKTTSFNLQQAEYINSKNIDSFSELVKDLLKEKYPNFPSNNEPGRPKKHISSKLVKYIKRKLTRVLYKKNKPFVDIGVLFGGMGVVEESIKQLKQENEFEDVEFRVVYCVEIDEKVREVYLKNWDINPEHYYKDITEVDEKKLPPVDFIITSPPCQSFSMSGLRKGFEDTRGTLTFDSLRIINYQRPKYVIYENVKGLVNHNDGKTFKIIKRSFSKIGYRNNWEIKNSLDFSLPQNRERIFGLLTRIDTKPIEFPQGELTTKCIGDFLENYVDDKYNLDRRYIMNNPRLNPNSSGFLSKTETHKYMKTSYEISQRVYDSEGFSPTLTCSNDVQISIKNENRFRKLTPRERMRIQGYSDDYKIPESIGTCRKITGNTIPVTVVKSLLKSVLNNIKEELVS